MSTHHRPQAVHNLPHCVSVCVNPSRARQGCIRIEDKGGGVADSGRVAAHEAISNDKRPEMKARLQCVRHRHCRAADRCRAGDGGLTPGRRPPDSAPRRTQHLGWAVLDPRPPQHPPFPAMKWPRVCGMWMASSNALRLGGCHALRAVALSTDPDLALTPATAGVSRRHKHLRRVLAPGMHGTHRHGALNGQGLGFADHTTPVQTHIAVVWRVPRGGGGRSEGNVRRLRNGWWAVGPEDAVPCPEFCDATQTVAWYTALSFGFTATVARYTTTVVAFRAQMRGTPTVTLVWGGTGGVRPLESVPGGRGGGEASHSAASRHGPGHRTAPPPPPAAGRTLASAVTPAPGARPAA